MFRQLIDSLARNRNVTRQVNPEAFSEAVRRAAPMRKGEMQISDMLTMYRPEEYALMRTFLSPDEMSGYALKDGDELVSVFSAAPGRGRQITEEAVLEGARRLDNFDVEGKLPQLYGGAGFRETGRFPYDPAYADDLSPFVNRARPDVVFMEMDPRVSSELSKLRGAGKKDLDRILQGGSGRVTRNRRAQDTSAALAALMLMSQLEGSE